MSDTSFGDYGEQGDFATDGQLEDTLSTLGLGEDEGGDAPPSANAVKNTLPIPRGGPLLEEPDAKKLFAMIDKTVLRQERVARNREEKKKHYENVRSNKPFAYLEKNEDRSIFKSAVAPDVADGEQPVPNKMDDLCNKIICQILADEFLPNPKPDGDADRDRGAADLAKKFLRNDGTATGTDDRQLSRDMLNMNITAGSAFVTVWVDPTGGGWRPKQINAHPRAEDPAKPMYAPKLDEQGQPTMTADGPIMEKATSPVLRYVAEVQNPEDPAKPTLQFTENAAEAARQWLPKHRRKVLNVNQVRTVPQSATVFEASQIILLMYDTVSEARKRFAVLDTLKKEELSVLCTWKPKRWKAIVPEAHRPKGSDEGATTVTEDTLIFWYESFCRIEPRYQDGAQVCVNGANGGFVLLRDTLREDVELDEGKTVPVLMDPPVSQFPAVPDIEDGDPFGMPPLARFGGGKDAWDSIWIGLFEAMHKALNRNTFIPGTSTVTREDMNRRDGTPIELLTAADKPIMEELTELPSFVPDMLEKIELALNSAAGTNETSNGLDSTYSESGVAKDIAIKQARTALAQYWQGFVKGICHYWKIKLQQAQGRLTVPQLVKLSGAESSYKQRWFVGSDLFGVSDVALASGSGTMQQPAEKAQHLAFMQGQTWISSEEAGELARASMSDDLGLPPNIHEEAADREIGEWSEGPPPGWMQQYEEQQQQITAHQTATSKAVAVLVQAGTDQQTATQAVQQNVPAPQLAPLPTPFEDRSNNGEPSVALIRHRRLTRMISSVEYTKHPLPWRALIDAQNTAARQAAGILTVAEQQQAAQQQASQADSDEQYQGFLKMIDQKARHLVETALAKVTAGDVMSGGDGQDEQATAADETASADADRAHESSEGDKNRETKLEIAARQHMAKQGGSTPTQEAR